MSQIPAQPPAKEEDPPNPEKSTPTKPIPRPQQPQVPQQEQKSPPKPQKHQGITPTPRQVTQRVITNLSKCLLAEIQSSQLDYGLLRELNLNGALEYGTHKNNHLFFRVKKKRFPFLFFKITAKLRGRPLP